MHLRQSIRLSGYISKVFFSVNTVDSSKKEEKLVII